MASSQDTEITLGTGKLLLLFFGLVGICALFFALGYSLGRKSEPGITTSNAALTSTPASPSGKASGTAVAPAMTFYKSVEQKDANPQLTPGSDPKAATSPAPTSGTAAATPAAANPSDSSATLPTSSYAVQVAAVTKQEDADALVDALKKKQYQAFVATQVGADKYFRVQVGPFSDIKDAEAMRARLIEDGYSPILKK